VYCVPLSEWWTSPSGSASQGHSGPKPKNNWGERFGAGRSRLELYPAELIIYYSNWVRAARDARAWAADPEGLSESEREKLGRLRKEVVDLRLDRKTTPQTTVPPGSRQNRGVPENGSRE
jgi:hypothetical protein